jgi:hypothetical protein
VERDFSRKWGVVFVGKKAATKNVGQKKERRLAPPLSCRCEGTPLTVDCISS